MDIFYRTDIFQFLLQIALAEKAGAVGLVLFLDPSAYAQGKTTYPNSWWLPPDGVMRGTAKNIDIGDPLTPSYPSTSKYLNS